MKLEAGKPTTTKLQLGLIANELPESTTEYEARFNGDLKDPAASYKDSVTTYNKWWVDNFPYVDTPEDNIDKTVVYRWWLSRFNMLDANMPDNTFQYPTSVEGALGYNNQIVLTSGMFIMDAKWFRNPEYSYDTWLSAGDTAKKGKSGYYYHDNPGDPANWNHSYTQYITRAGWDSYKVHGGPANLWANANAAAQAYRSAGDTENADKMQKVADEIKKEVTTELWNPDTKLIQHRFIGSHNGNFAKYKELNNYYPYSEGLMPTGDKDYNEALRLFADAKEFPIFPFFTANQADKETLAALNGGKPVGSNNFSIINAQPLLQIYSAGIRNYDAAKNGYISNENFKKLLYWVAFAHYQGGNNQYPDQNEFWNEDNNPGSGTIAARTRTVARTAARSPTAPGFTTPSSAPRTGRWSRTWPAWSRARTTRSSSTRSRSPAGTTSR